jgi:hypothetical protein
MTSALEHLQESYYKTYYNGPGEHFMWSLLVYPKNYTVTINRHGLLQFRHPWVADDKGYGIPIACSFAKLEPKERARTKSAAEELLENPPRDPDQPPPNIHPRLWKAYSRPLRLLKRQERFVIQTRADDTLEVQGVPASRQSVINESELIIKVGAEIRTLQDTNRALAAAYQKALLRIEECERTIIRQQQELNQHVDATLEEAFAAFQKDYNPGKPQTKYDTENNIKKFIFGRTSDDGQPIAGLGAKKKLVDVSANEIDRWIDAHPSQNRATLIHLRANLSIFWTTCARIFDLNFTPFSAGKLKRRGDLLALARKKRPVAITRLDDLKMFLDAFEPDLYWQSWVAFACLAGPRWMEQANLPADALDLEADPPRATIQADTTHDLKTVGNTIPLERKLLLPIMLRFRATWEEGRSFVWPSLSRQRLTQKRQTVTGAWPHSAFTRVFEKIRAAARDRSRDPKHPLWEFGPAEYRHTYGTLLALAGNNATEIARMMRNSTEVASAHYIAFCPVDQRIRGELVWH